MRPIGCCLLTITLLLELFWIIISINDPNSLNSEISNPKSSYFFVRLTSGCPMLMTSLRLNSIFLNDFGLIDANVKIMKKGTSNVIKSNKCNQCDYDSLSAGGLRKHLKMHSGDKSNKCNQCEFASSDSSNLRTHLKTHNGEKTNKCNQCDYASSRADHLRTHLRTHSDPMWL